MLTLTAPTSTHRIDVAIHGATTPRGRELAALLRLHPKVARLREVTVDGAVLVGRDAAAEPLWDTATTPLTHPHVVFVCLPPSAARQVIEQATAAGSKVVDLSGSLRDEDYGLGISADAGEGETAYGLPELSGERLADAEHVANPGSVATCATLALAPAAMAGHLDPHVHVETRVGLSKAAPKLTPTRSEVRTEVQENLRELHRGPREPRVEVERTLDPANRGVVTTTVLSGAELSEERLHPLYATFYADAPCVDVLPAGLPSLPTVQGTNTVQIGIRKTVDGDIEISSALDDTLKGSCGQAIQTLNLMCGFPETLGLPEFELTPHCTTPRLHPRL